MSVLADEPFDVPYELVERKGVGHPDTMCDAIAERASRLYAQHCLDRFGRVAHHWFDKVLLFGGEADVDYGVGDLTVPYTVLFAGKGAYAVGDEPIPLEDILFRASADVLAEVTTGFDESRHLRVECRIVDHQGAGRGNSRYRPQSVDDLVEIGDPTLTSNDTNLLHGHAPLSALEALVLGVEQYVNGDMKATHPNTGWDVKVFGSRRDREFRLVVNMPFLARCVQSLDDYFEQKAKAVDAIATYVTDAHGLTVDLLVNPTDRNGLPYLTALGSVADTGDVGVVGRGNRINGLITPMRPMSIEAPAGKNPLDHTGKLYGVLAQRLAERVHATIGHPAEVHIFTSKEAPLHSPDEVVVRLAGWTASGVDEATVSSIVADALADMAGLTREIIYDGIAMW